MTLFLPFFSIENFKRPQPEVDELLKLAQEKFERLIEEKDRLAEHGVRVNVIGNLSLLPTDMQLLVEKATSLTRKNQRQIKSGFICVVRLLSSFQNEGP